ncbi:MAG: type I pullulanase [Bacilli bacterium]|jgi:pullulanase|nr:type I pullulanase [Bacilli bacterium]
MKDTFLSARLVEDDLIRLVVFSLAPYENLNAVLVKDHQIEERIAPTKTTSTTSLIVADFRLKEPLPLGHSYVLSLPSYGLAPLEVTEATTFPDFDELYDYDGDDLGANYAPERTSFVLWAPLSSAVWLKIRRKGANEWSYFAMVRFPKGVYRYIASGDYDEAEYVYLLTTSELSSVATDPYAKGSAPNGEFSVVIDPARFVKCDNRDALPVLNSATDAIVYEGNVRDLTIDKHTDIVHKGTFLGLSESDRKTEGGNPAGLDYLASLGITHLQLQPLFDFKTIDELNPTRKYNWGYDPAQYFVPEGSYASDVKNPYSRINELQTLVAALHEKGIRVSMDCVYNHVYEYASSVFERVVPNYYFRRRPNGKMANASRCGNDVASERPMVRKLIVDCCRYWIENYGIDAFRFDLMGIMDEETMKEIARMAKSHDESFLLYGEGWNMGAEAALPLATMDNYKDLPEYAFFNDGFREAFKAWLTGDGGQGAYERVAHAYVSSSLDFYGAPRFLGAEQSLNYVECHDNETFFDYVSSRAGEWPLKERLAACKLGLAMVLVSFGIPFIHAGQEIGQSKFGKGNTYNLPDLYNKFSYRLLDERKAMYDYFKGLTEFRRRSRYLRAYDPRVIAELIDVSQMEGGGLLVVFRDGNAIAPYKEVVFAINPSRQGMSCDLGEDHLVIVDASGYVAAPSTRVQRALIPPHAFMAFAR